MKLKILAMMLILVVGFFQGQIIAESWSNIYGKVIDAETKEPVPNAWAIFQNIVDESGRKISTKTNKKGEFEFKGFPVDEFENELYVSDQPGLTDTKYYNQSYTIIFKMQKGKNLFLPPIEMKRGVSIEGTIKLWDGSIVEKGRIYFDIKNRDEFDSTITWWAALSPVTDGHYISSLLPPGVELEMKADLLQDVDKGVAYDEVKKTIILSKNGTDKNIDIIVPNIRTEIKGTIVNKSGNALNGQEVGLEDTGVHLTTDENGAFRIRHIKPGEIQLYVTYTIDTFKTHSLEKLKIHEGEGLSFEITLDSQNYLNYNIKRYLYK